MSSKLFDYLVELNTCAYEWGIWVNPENPTEDFRIGQKCHENGGVDDNWIYIGSLYDLSFGHQSYSEALVVWLKDHKDYTYSSNVSVARINYKGKETLVSIKKLQDVYENGYLNSGFEIWLNEQLEPIMKSWSEEETNNFIYEKLPLLLENDYE